MGVESKVLNRVVRRNDRGYEIEADPLHAELIAEQVLEPGARTLSTPGLNPGNEDEEDQELEGGERHEVQIISGEVQLLEPR